MEISKPPVMSADEVREFLISKKFKIFHHIEQSYGSNYYSLVTENPSQPLYPIQLVSVAYKNSPFCCGMVELGGWPYYESDNVNAYLNALLGFLHHFQAWELAPLKLTTLNRSGQPHIEKLLLKNGWRIDRCFIGTHGQEVSVLSTNAHRYDAKGTPLTNLWNEPQPDYSQFYAVKRPVDANLGQALRG